MADEKDSKEADSMSVLWILGEAKSGKSELAEAIFAHLPGKKFYIGTLPRTSKNMNTIKKHVNQRPKDWELVEIADSLDVATRSIGRSGKNEVIAAILDGWGVYARCKASQWGKDNTELTTTGEAHFVDNIYSEYRRLVDVCDYLVVVAHVSAHPPADSDYELDRITSRVRAVTSRCIAEPGKVIYHDVEDVSHKDRGYVEQIADEMIVAASA